MSAPVWCVVTDTGLKGCAVGETSLEAAQAYLDSLTQPQRDAVTEVDVSPPIQKQAVHPVSSGTAS